MVIIDIESNTSVGGLTLDPAGMHCPSWDDAFVSSRTYSRRALYNLPQTLHVDRARRAHQNNKHVNKVRKATGRAEAITAGRQQNKQQYLIIQLMKKTESMKTGQERQQYNILEWRRGTCLSAVSLDTGTRLEEQRLEVTKARRTTN